MPIYALPDELKNGYVPAGSVVPQPETLPEGVNPKPPAHTKKPNIIDALMPLPKFNEVKDYNPFPLADELKGYELFATKFANSRSPEETAAIKQQIDAQKSVFGVESASGVNTLITASTIGFIALFLLGALIYNRIRN